MIGFKTLASRLFALTSIWAVISIVLIAWLIAQNYRANAQDNLSARLTASLYNIMGSVQRDNNNGLTGAPDLRDSRYLQYQSGYYWRVAKTNSDSKPLQSASLTGGIIKIPETSQFDSSFQRNFLSRDQAGNELLGIEAQAFLGEGDDLYSFIITGNLSEIDTQVADFIKQLLLLLSIFALGFIATTYFIVRFGLSPLNRATEELSEIRLGNSQTLKGEFPREIQPLIDETNSLIKSNNLVIERARTQVGNLAHSLKTPLAVLINEAEKLDGAKRKIVEDQVRQMQAQIQGYLDRARISARSGTVTSRSELKPVFDQMCRVIQKLNPDLEIKQVFGLEKNAYGAVEKQDLEEILGNLLENASKFAKKRVLLRASTEAQGMFSIKIEDDGPGISNENAAEAMKRGKRLDETKPGSGLGLSIVNDIVKEYNGKLTLGKSDLGGLAAIIILPLVK